MGGGKEGAKTSQPTPVDAGYSNPVYYGHGQVRTCMLIFGSVVGVTINLIVRFSYHLHKDSGTLHGKASYLHVVTVLYCV